MKSQRYKGQLYEQVKWRKTSSGRLYEKLHASKSIIGELYRATFIAPMYPYFDEDKLLGRLCKKGSTVIDVGGNVGSFAGISKRDINYIRLDIDPSTKPNIIADALHLPFKDNSIDVIIAKAIFEHIKDPFLATKEIRRVLKKGGVLFLLVPFFYRIHASPNDFYRFTKDGLKYILRNFKEIEIKACGGYMSALGNCFYIGTYALDSLWGLGFLTRVILWPLLRILSYLDIFDKYQLTPIYYYAISTK